MHRSYWQIRDMTRRKKRTTNPLKVMAPVGTMTRSGNHYPPPKQAKPLHWWRQRHNPMDLQIYGCNKSERYGEHYSSKSRHIKDMKTLDDTTKLTNQKQTRMCLSRIKSRTTQITSQLDGISWWINQSSISSDQRPGQVNNCRQKPGGVCGWLHQADREWLQWTGKREGQGQ